MSKTENILILTEDEQIPERLTDVLDQLELSGQPCHPRDLAERVAIDCPSAVVLATEQLARLDQAQMTNLTVQLDELALGALILGEEAVGAAGAASIPAGRGLFCTKPGESTEMIKGRLATLVETKIVLQRMKDELKRLRQSSQPLNDHFTAVTEEMQLAARLQHDFLPRQLPELPNIRFATIYRPASWVSGDMYDIARLDENHICFYVADAVGHGMPAALLTMFIKRAIVTKRIEGSSYTLIDPGEVLGRLNEDLLAQEFSNFQFATCCYGILDTRTYELRVASAGHPAPMRIDKQANVQELPVSGSLLGVMPDQGYDVLETKLEPGDKLLVYSDGVEVAFEDDGPDKPLRFPKEFDDLADQDAQTMCERLAVIIDQAEGSLHPRDDVTIVALEFDELPK